MESPCLSNHSGVPTTCPTESTWEASCEMGAIRSCRTETRQTFGKEDYCSFTVRIINTCTVRDKSITSFENLYREAEQKHIPVVIAGCMTEGCFSDIC